MKIIKKIHFAYPNVKLTQGKFIGCGRYIASDDTPGEEYKPASGIMDIAEVERAASILARESFDTGREIFETKDKLGTGQRYAGTSKHLAYFLTLVRRSRDIEIPLGSPLRKGEARGDVWCTGSIEVFEGKYPILKPVAPDGFSIKLEKGFLTEENKDLLFIVPESNIQSLHEDLCREKQVRILSLSQFRETVSEKISEKTVLKVHGDELDLLVSLLFSLGSNPYKGLEAFGQGDADRFFGREKLTQEIFNKFQAIHEAPGDDASPRRFLAILGPSGSGKSSVARAGLVPELLRRPLPGVKQNRVAVFKPGQYPLERLADALAGIVGENGTYGKKTGNFAERMRQANDKGQWDEDGKNGLLLQRYKHEADALIRSADLFAGHILLGAVSAVERDAEAMHHHHKLAMSHHPKQTYKVLKTS